MPGLARVLTVIASALVVASCGANFSTAYRTYEVDKSADATTVVIDAKQRAILSAPGGETEIVTEVSGSGDGQSTKTTKTERRRLIVCAEPSPDALSAISASFSGSFGGIFGPSSEVQAALANSFSETASQLGVRNATIQLLRDGLYRQCEAYMNGLIGEQYYEEIAHKYVNAMVTLLVIEELTPGAAKAFEITAEEGSVVTADTNIAVSGPQPEEPEPGEDPEGDDQEEEAETAEPGTAGGRSSAPAPVVGVNLPANTGKVEPHISAAVSTLVTWFLTKDTVDYCLRILARGATREGYELADEFKDVCTQVVLMQMGQQSKIAGIAASIGTGTFGTDECSEALRTFWKPGGVANDENRDKILAAMTQADLQEDSITLLINSAQQAEGRRKVGRILRLPACI